MIYIPLQNDIRPQAKSPPAPRPQCLCNPGAWFNPRRRWFAEVLVDHLRLNQKMYLDDRYYQRLLDETELDPYQLELALSDLYTLGVVTFPTVNTVVLLSKDIDKWGGQ